MAFFYILCLVLMDESQDEINANFTVKLLWDKKIISVFFADKADSIFIVKLSSDDFISANENVKNYYTV